MAKVKLSAPWTTCYRQFQAFFKNDPGVKVVFNENGPEIKLYVEDSAKAEALGQLIEPTRTYGTVTLKITVIPANNGGDLPDARNFVDDISLIKAALKGNLSVCEINEIDMEFISNKMCFVVFEKKVVQFFNDNLCDIHGLTSTLMQDIAEEVFSHHNGVFFCTASDEDTLGVPLGEWP